MNRLVWSTASVNVAVRDFLVVVSSEVFTDALEMTTGVVDEDDGDEDDATDEDEEDAPSGARVFRDLKENFGFGTNLPRRELKFSDMALTAYTKWIPPSKLVIALVSYRVEN